MLLATVEALWTQGSIMIMFFYLGTHTITSSFESREKRRKSGVACAGSRKPKRAYVWASFTNVDCGMAWEKGAPCYGRDKTKGSIMIM